MRLSGDVFLPALAYRRNPWKPKKGLILSGAGQNSIESILAMSLAMGDDRKPALVAFYEGVADGQYIRNWQIREIPVLFPGAVIQIGFELPSRNEEQMKALARGEWNDALREAARFYRDLALPVLLRIGYEFDGHLWNHYKPDTYIRTFRQFVNVIESEGARNVACVWDAYSVGVDITPDYYPGDDAVDWFGYNSIIPNYSDENHMAQMAKAHGKPIMSGEAGYALRVDEVTYHDWVQGYFDGMRRDGVQAFQYINWEWGKSRRKCGWTHWASSRFTDHPERTKAYLETMHGEDMVYRDASYAQPVCLYIDTTMNCYEAKAPGVWRKECDAVCVLPGYDYNVKGVIPKHEEPLGALWQIEGRGELTITAPDDFWGECIFYLPKNTGTCTEESFILYINGEPIKWNNTSGWIHIPVESGGEIHFMLERRDGKPLFVRGIALVKKLRTLQAPAPIANQRGLTWKPLPEALHYRVFVGRQLIGVTGQPWYPLPEEAEGMYGVEAVYRYDGASKIAPVHIA